MVWQFKKSQVWRFSKDLKHLASCKNTETDFRVFIHNFASFYHRHICSHINTTTTANCAPSSKSLSHTHLWQWDFVAVSPKKTKSIFIQVAHVQLGCVFSGLQDYQDITHRTSGNDGGPARPSLPFTHQLTLCLSGWKLHPAVTDGKFRGCVISLRKHFAGQAEHVALIRSKGISPCWLFGWKFFPLIFR